eukprot:TCALIF_12429-PA protein Name:"Similar to amy Alpha-amylase (Pseudoalteromonas haloplanktis)" AED:0.41 eAED:0.41 QI:0/0/0/0.25/1/1/4/0/209
MLVVLGCAPIYLAQGYTDSQCQGDRTVIVHLFEWTWGEIARECEEFLGPKGYCGVQVSPPHEHIVTPEWWARYQVVSYQLESRGGTRDEFIEMVQRCDAVGVNIIVDGILNHATGMDQTISWARAPATHRVQAVLDQRGMREVKHVLPGESYVSIKAALIDAFDKSTERKVEELFNIASLGDRKVLSVVRHALGLVDNDFDVVFRPSAS